jgi:hypothetical protein
MREAPPCAAASDHQGRNLVEIPRPSAPSRTLRLAFS